VNCHGQRILPANLPRTIAAIAKIMSLGSRIDGDCQALFCDVGLNHRSRGKCAAWGRGQLWHSDLGQFSRDLSSGR
jgi:hypothetical protein